MKLFASWAITRRYLIWRDYLAQIRWDDNYVWTNWKDLARRIQGKRIFRRPKSRREENVKTGLNEIGAWIQLAQDRVEYQAVLNV